MIISKFRFETDEVAAHYNDLDRFYREIWGEHLHHGLWFSRKQTSQEATHQLIAEVAAEARLQPGDHLCDVGCGYGATARFLVREYGAIVTALTVSEVQHRYAVSLEPEASNPTYFLRDWLASGLEPASFDVVIAIESTEHMVELKAFYAEVARVLRPGGRLVVCAWLSRETPRFWERRFILEPICREGRLCGMGSASDYHRCSQAAGLVPIHFQDVSQQVKRTWPVCAGRVVQGFLKKPSYRRFLFRAPSSNKIFALTLLRIWLAYELGSMRYGILTAVKPTVQKARR
jgi:tocopherol O-methyltransferase